jgi:hypothetical protein
MEQTKITRSLRAIAEQGIPNDVNLWPTLQARLGSTPRVTTVSLPVLRQARPVRLTLTRRQAALALAGAMVALVPGLGLATPMAENAFGKFVQRFGLVLVPSTTLPGPPDAKMLNAKIVGTPVAGQQQVHLVVNGIPVTPGSVPPPPAKLPPGKAAAFFALQLKPIPLDQAQKQVHFNVRAPSWVPPGLTLEGALVTPGLLAGGGAVSAVASTKPSGSVHVEQSSGVIDVAGPADPKAVGTPGPSLTVSTSAVYRAIGDDAGSGTPVAGGIGTGRAIGAGVVVTTDPAGRLVASDVPTSLTIVYSKNGAARARLQVTEAEAGKAMGMIVPESAAQSLTVNGHPASYAHGKWRPANGDPASGLQWDSTADDGVLSWDDRGLTYVIWSSGLGLSRDDLVRVGESLK